MTFGGELIEECQLLLGDPHGDYHTQARMVIHLNRALRGLSARSQSIESWIFSSVREDEFRYGLPHDFLRAKYVGFMSSSQGFYRLRPRNEGVVDFLSQGDFGGGSEPYYYSIHGRSSQERLVAVVDSADPSDYSFVSSEVDDSTDNSNVLPYDRVLNIADGSEGIVEDIDGTRVHYTPLIGGTRPRFEAGDEFRILDPSTSLQTLNLTPVPRYTSDEGEEPLGVYYSRYHRPIDAGLIAIGNDTLEIDPELEECLLQYVCYWAAVAEHEAHSPQAQAFMAEYNRLYFSGIPKVKKRIRANLQGWVRYASNRPRVANLTGAPDIGGHPFTRGVIN